MTATPTAISTSTCCPTRSIPTSPTNSEATLVDLPGITPGTNWERFQATAKANLRQHEDHIALQRLPGQRGAGGSGCPEERYSPVLIGTVLEVVADEDVDLFGVLGWLDIDLDVYRSRTVNGHFLAVIV